MNLVTRLRTVFDEVSLDGYRWFLGDLPDFPQPESPGCWRLLTQNEAEGWVRDHPSRRADQRRVHEVALENRHLLFVASHEGTDVGRLWVGRGWLYVDRPDYVMVRLHPDIAYSYDLFVDKAYRRRGFASDGFPFRLQTVRQHGLRRYAVGVVAANRGGRRRLMNLGFPWWDALRFRVGGRAVWLKGRPWERIADRVLTERTPP
jgi:GNAT superfamily N-acetyltransferase